MSMPTRVLLVEDEPLTAEAIRVCLIDAGFEVVHLTSGIEVPAYLKRHPQDIVLLDLTLPGKDGLAICAELRAQSTIPVIIVTARSEQVDKLKGLGLGADDYMCKPVFPPELIARMHALLRRTYQWPQAQPEATELDEGSHELRMDGQAVALTPVEFRVLRALIKARGRVLSRSQLQAHGHVDHRVVSDRTIDSHIKNLRAKLRAVEPSLDHVHAVYGSGYRWMVKPS